MDKETIKLIMENIYDEKEAAKYMQLSNSQFHILIENHSITPIKDHFYFKQDLDDYLQQSYSLKQRNVKEAIFYYTMMQFTHDNERECEATLHLLEMEKHFRLSAPFYENMYIAASYLHISEVTFYKAYMKMEAYFMNLPRQTKILCKEDAIYPIMLKEEREAPYFIFVIGNLDLLERKGICITGSEHPREEEIKKAIYLTKYFSKENQIILTGLERGVSTYILLEMMKNKLPGIAVLSCSLLDLFPKENKQLYEYICENGLVITEFLYQSYNSKHLHERNQILASLAEFGILLGGKDFSELISVGEELRKQNKPLYLPYALSKSYMHYPKDFIELGAKYFSTIGELESYIQK